MRSGSQGCHLRQAQNVLEMERLLTHSRHIRVERRNALRPLDRQLQQRITVGGSLSQATPVIDQTIEMRQKAACNQETA
jgi:hypothetical protein